MAEEPEKYKQILKREEEEFQEVMKPEVSTSLPPKLIRKSRTPAKRVITYFILNFAIFFLIDILFPSYCYYYITLF